MSESFYIANSYRQAEEKPNKAIKWLDKATSFFTRNWLLKVILQFLPVIWSPIVLKIGPMKDLLTLQDGSLNRGGIIIGSIIYAFSFILTFSTSYKSYRDQIRTNKIDLDWNALIGEINLRKTISSGENIIENKRVRKLSRIELQPLTSNTICKGFISSGFNPREHISDILDEIANCITKITPVTRHKIRITAAVSLDDSSWIWLVRPQNSGVASLDDLLNEKNHSTFLSMVKEKTFLYYNDKKNASDNGLYHLDDNDKSAKNIGSIVCWKITVTTSDNAKATMIISISTTEIKLLDEQYDSSPEILETFYVKRLKNIVLEHFEGELRENLLLYRMIQ